MTLVCETLLLWVLIQYLHLNLIATVIVIVLFVLGRCGFVNIVVGNGKVLRL